MNEAGFAIEVTQITSRCGRAENEDTVFVREYGNRLIAAVADGLGGQGCGNLASSQTAQCLSALEKDIDNPSESALRALFSRANDDIIKLQKQSGCKMMSTLVVLHIAAGRFLIAHAGDSRAYLFRRGKIAFQTADHSVPQLDVKAGVIKPEQIRFHPQRNQLLQAIGGRQTITPDIFCAKPEPEDAFLLCSDGFWELINEEEMREDLRRSSDVEDWMKLMLTRVQARLTEDSDNLSAVAARIIKA